ncbi:MAG: DinB family protein [Bacteroidota bacterium]|nr:DinB family protein [Bacteroidota bacterium]
MSNENTHIAEQLRLAYEGEAWHGPALRGLLVGVNAKQAAAKPMQNVHSIWEIVLHITTWQSVVRKRLAGEAVEPTEEEDWKSVIDSGESAWKKTIMLLEQSLNELLNAVLQFDESRLEQTVPGKDYSNRFMIFGVLQHNLYHTGQIALLKKL